MQNLLSQYYPPFTVERPGHETAYAVTDAFAVTPTTFTVEQKRAIGDFFLFVGRRAMAFLMHEILAQIDAKIENYPQPIRGDHSKLYNIVYESMFSPILERIDAIWAKYPLSPPLHEDMSDYHDSPLGVKKGLAKLSRFALGHEFNTHAQYDHAASFCLMRDFIELIHLVKMIFHLTISAPSEDILSFLSFVGSEGNASKINAFLDTGSLQSRFSPWSALRPPIDPLALLSSDRAEWHAVYPIINMCIHLPLREVLVPAFGDISQQYYPRRVVRQRPDSAIADCERRVMLKGLEESAYHVWRTLFCHPLFIDFWYSLLQIYPPGVLHAEMERLLRDNDEDLQFKAHLSSFLGLFFEPHSHALGKRIER
jgi:hypothetical protein